jgi:hypothetical protein
MKTLTKTTKAASAATEPTIVTGKVSGFDLAGYLEHPGDRFGITATAAQMAAWSKSYKGSRFDTMREWAADALDAAATSTSKPTASKPLSVFKPTTLELLESCTEPAPQHLFHLRVGLLQFERWSVAALKSGKRFTDWLPEIADKAARSSEKPRRVCVAPRGNN